MQQSVIPDVYTAAVKLPSVINSVRSADFLFCAATTGSEVIFCIYE